MSAGIKANNDGSAAIQVGGVDRVYLTDTGNVGISTTSPAQSLQLGDNTSATEMIRFASTSANFDVGLTASGCEIGTGNNQPIIFKTNAAERARITELGLFQFNSGYGSVATAYGCRAWVNFNGTGTVAIRASGNVTSITDNGAGDYTVNFTTAMPDANYAVSMSVFPQGDSKERPELVILSSGSVRVQNDNGLNVLFDTPIFTVAIFR